MEAASKRGRRNLVHRGVELVCSLQFEEQALAAGHAVVAGVDEVGRGALCGPVVAAAVVDVAVGRAARRRDQEDVRRLTRRANATLSPATVLLVESDAPDGVAWFQMNHFSGLLSWY